MLLYVYVKAHYNLVTQWCLLHGSLGLSRYVRSVLNNVTALCSCMYMCVCVLGLCPTWGSSYCPRRDVCVALCWNSVKLASWCNCDAAWKPLCHGTNVLLNTEHMCSVNISSPCACAQCLGCGFAAACPDLQQQSLNAPLTRWMLHIVLIVTKTGNTNGTWVVVLAEAWS